MPTVLFCAGLLVVVLMGGLLNGCGQSQPTSRTQETITAVGAPITQAPCSIVLVIAGQRQRVTGDRGATVTVGSTQITFAPNCSSEISESTETTTTNQPPAAQPA